MCPTSKTMSFWTPLRFHDSQSTSQQPTLIVSTDLFPSTEFSFAWSSCLKWSAGGDQSMKGRTGKWTETACKLGWIKGVGPGSWGHCHQDPRTHWQEKCHQHSFMCNVGQEPRGALTKLSSLLADFFIRLLSRHPQPTHHLADTDTAPFPAAAAGETVQRCLLQSIAFQDNSAKRH